MYGGLDFYFDSGSGKGFSSIKSYANRMMYNYSKSYENRGPGITPGRIYRSIGYIDEEGYNKFKKALVTDAWIPGLSRISEIFGRQESYYDKFLDYERQQTDLLAKLVDVTQRKLFGGILKVASILHHEKGILEGLKSAFMKYVVPLAGVYGMNKFFQHSNNQLFNMIKGKTGIDVPTQVLQLLFHTSPMLATSIALLSGKGGRSSLAKLLTSKNFYLSTLFGPEFSQINAITQLSKNSSSFQALMRNSPIARLLFPELYQKDFKGKLGAVIGKNYFLSQDPRLRMMYAMLTGSKFQMFGAMLEEKFPWLKYPVLVSSVVKDLLGATIAKPIKGFIDRTTHKFGNLLKKIDDKFGGFFGKVIGKVKKVFGLGKQKKPPQEEMVDIGKMSLDQEKEQTGLLDSLLSSVNKFFGPDSLISRSLTDIANYVKSIYEKISGKVRDFRVGPPSEVLGRTKDYLSDSYEKLRQQEIGKIVAEDVKSINKRIKKENIVKAVGRKLVTTFVPFFGEEVADALGLEKVTVKDVFDTSDLKTIKKAKESINKILKTEESKKSVTNEANEAKNQAKKYTGQYGTYYPNPNIYNLGSNVRPINVRIENQQFAHLIEIQKKQYELSQNMQKTQSEIAEHTGDLVKEDKQIERIDKKRWKMDKLRELFDMLKGIGSSVFDTGKGIFHLLKKVGPALFPFLGGIIKKALGKGWGFLKGAASKGWGLLKKLFGFGEDVSADGGMIAGDLLGKVFPIISYLYGGYRDIIDFYHGFKKGGILGALKGVFIGNTKAPWYSRMFGQAAKYGAIGAAIGSVIPGAGTLVGGAIGSAVGAIEGLLSPIIKQVGISIKNFAISAFKVGGKRLLEIVGNLFGFDKFLFDELREHAGGLFKFMSYTVSGISKIFTSIGGFLKHVVSSIVHVIGAIAHGIMNFADKIGIGGPIKAVVGKIFGGIKSGASKVISFIGGILGTQTAYGDTLKKSMQNVNMNKFNPNAVQKYHPQINKQSFIQNRQFGGNYEPVNRSLPTQPIHPFINQTYHHPIQQPIQHHQFNEHYTKYHPIIEHHIAKHTEYLTSRLTSQVIRSSAKTLNIYIPNSSATTMNIIVQQKTTGGEKQSQSQTQDVTTQVPSTSSVPIRIHTVAQSISSTPTTPSGSVSVQPSMSPGAYGITSMPSSTPTPSGISMSRILKYFGMGSSQPQPTPTQQNIQPSGGSSTTTQIPNPGQPLNIKFPSIGKAPEVSMVGSFTPKHTIGGNPGKFIQWLYPYAVLASAQSGMPVSYILGQAAWESGWGKHAPGFNFFGIKWWPSDARDPYVSGFMLLRTFEYTKSGQKYSTYSKFRKYASPLYSFFDHNLFLRGKRYRNLWSTASFSNPYTYGALLRADGYATDPAYGTKVGNMIKSIQLHLKQMGLIDFNFAGENRVTSYQQAAQYLSQYGLKVSVSGNTQTAQVIWPSGVGTTSSTPSGFVSVQPSMSAGAYGITSSGSEVPIPQSSPISSGITMSNLLQYFGGTSQTQQNIQTNLQQSGGGSSSSTLTDLGKPLDVKFPSIGKAPQISMIGSFTPKHEIGGNPGKFIKDLYPYAVLASAQAGIPVSYILGQAAWESGWGKHAPGFNFFGMKWWPFVAKDPYVAGFLTLRTFEYGKQGKYYTTAKFRKYTSPLYSFLDHNLFLRGKRYRNLWTTASFSNPYTYGALLKADGYATDPSYPSKIAGMIKSIQKHLKEMGLIDFNFAGQNRLTSYQQAAQYLSGFGLKVGVGANAQTAQIVWPSGGGSSGSSSTLSSSGSSGSSISSQPSMSAGAYGITASNIFQSSGSSGQSISLPSSNPAGIDTLLSKFTNLSPGQSSGGIASVIINAKKAIINCTGENEDKKKKSEEKFNQEYQKINTEFQKHLAKSSEILSKFNFTPQEKQQHKSIISILHNSINNLKSTKLKAPIPILSKVQDSFRKLISINIHTPLDMIKHLAPGMLGIATSFATQFNNTVHHMYGIHQVTTNANKTVEHIVASQAKIPVVHSNIVPKPHKLQHKTHTHITQDGKTFTSKDGYIFTIRRIDGKTYYETQIYDERFHTYQTITLKHNPDTKKGREEFRGVMREISVLGYQVNNPDGSQSRGLDLNGPVVPISLSSQNTTNSKLLQATTPIPNNTNNNIQQQNQSQQNTGYQQQNQTPQQQLQQQQNSNQSVMLNNNVNSPRKVVTYHNVHNYSKVNTSLRM